jgi:hypothetical protein
MKRRQYAVLVVAEGTDEIFRGSSIATCVRRAATLIADGLAEALTTDVRNEPVVTVTFEVIETPKGEVAINATLEGRYGA